MNKYENKLCKSCRFLDSGTSTCQLKGVKMNPEEDFCSRHQIEVVVCEACNKIATKNSFVVVAENETFHIVCNKCSANLTSCAFCTQCQNCDFETNTSTLPKIVQKQIQQGPMIQVVQIKNPERIKITCQAGCKCWNSAENACEREIGYCPNYEFIWRSPVKEDEPSPSAPESEENGNDTETENT